MRILLTGHSGFVGGYIEDSLARVSNFEVVGVSRHSGFCRCDLTKFDDVACLFDKWSPDLIVHCAGELDVDICQRDMIHAWRANLLSTKNIVVASQNAIPVVFMSSIAVYPDSPGFHEEANVGPENFYGLLKLFSETLVLRNPKSLILRFVCFGNSAVQKRLSLTDYIKMKLTIGQQVNLFHDEFFNPLNVNTFARLVGVAIEHKLYGIFNVGSIEGLSKWEFGIRVAKHFGLDPSLINAVSYSSNLERVAPRARDSRLSVSKLASHLSPDTTMPTIDEEICKL